MHMVEITIVVNNYKKLHTPPLLMHYQSRAYTAVDVDSLPPGIF